MHFKLGLLSVHLGGGRSNKIFVK